MQSQKSEQSTRPEDKIIFAILERYNIFLESHLPGRYTKDPIFQEIKNLTDELYRLTNNQ